MIQKDKREFLLDTERWRPIKENRMPEKAPIDEQLDEKTKKEIKDLQKDYTIAPDGTVVKINDYFANPETPEKQLS